MTEPKEPKKYHIDYYSLIVAFTPIWHRWNDRGGKHKIVIFNIQFKQLIFFKYHHTMFSIIFWQND